LLTLRFSCGEATNQHLLSKPDEKASLIITTNLSFSEWIAVLGDARRATAPLDWIMYRCDNLESELPLAGFT